MARKSRYRGETPPYRKLREFPPDTVVKLYGDGSGPLATIIRHTPSSTLVKIDRGPDYPHPCPFTGQTLKRYETERISSEAHCVPHPKAW